ncbi:MAG: hypothetical protein JRJ76_17765 [Deltaproteobacteria bacterium]|nr:hypothetical protein [Deltaproteobacteria bacterium]
MTDNQIEKFIRKEIQKRKVSLQDMIGGEFIDPDPDDKTNLSNQRTRPNRFSELFSEHRMKELLCVGEYNPYNDMPLLKVDLLQKRCLQMKYWERFSIILLTR